jgi:hypothetical protein
MKKLKMTILLLLSMMFVTKTFAQTGSSEQLTVPLSSPGKPYTLKVELVEGSIKVVSYEGKDIVIDVTPSVSEDGDESSNAT